VATQAYANPALGPHGLSLLAGGTAPGTVLHELRSLDRWQDHRQIAVLDAHGAVATFTGKENQEWRGHRERPGLVVMGNYLKSADVIDAMQRAFDASDGLLLEERLLLGLEAGKAAGGERGGQHSAGLIVAGRDAYARTDLRIDWYEGAGEDDAVSELRRLFNRYKPLIPYYEQRPMNPQLPSWRTWLASRG
jgi:uncharacterized Ntn-hydrolase superfamily protein